MTTSHIILLTGATSGLGLNTLRQLAKRSDTHLIIGVRNLHRTDRLQAIIPKHQLTIFPLDLASLESVRDFAAMTVNYLDNRQLTAIALNAGIQITTGLEVTEDGYERTFASNYLGHFLLTGLLLSVLSSNGAIVSTASGTHDRQDLLARLFGFRGGLFPSAEAVASGVLDNRVSLKQQCLDRYATSKLCNILFTYDLARRIRHSKVRFLAFDPGLMPGTSLARDRSPIERWAWKYILPILRLFVPGVSSPERSARSLSELLTDSAIAPIGGSHFDYRLKQTRTSSDSRREDWQQELYSLGSKLSGIEIGHWKER